MTVRYAKHVSRRQTSQREPIPGETQVQNNAGGGITVIRGSNARLRL